MRKAARSRLGLDAGSADPIAGPSVDLSRIEEEQVSSRILSQEGYVAGWLDSTVHDFLEVLSPRAQSTKYALITCLDSNVKPASLLDRSPELKAHADEFESIGGGLLIPTAKLIEIEKGQRILFGFDELWFFRHREIEPKPSSASIVGPGRLDKARLGKLGKWMKASECTMGLGGGEGLNFVVRAHGLARIILGFSIEQPELSLAGS
jgi:hypothetical protein